MLAIWSGISPETTCFFLTTVEVDGPSFVPSPTSIGLSLSATSQAIHHNWFHTFLWVISKVWKRTLKCSHPHQTSQTRIFLQQWFAILWHLLTYFQEQKAQISAVCKWKTSLGLFFLITWFTDPPTRFCRILKKKKKLNDIFFLI